MNGFKKAKDRNGDYRVNWSLYREAEGSAPPSRIEFIPFDRGDARVPSLPCDEAIYCGVGDETGLTHAVIALRVGDRAVHSAMSVSRLRQFAQSLMETADLIDRKGTRA